ARLLTALFSLGALVSFVPAAPVPTHLMPRDPPLTFPTTVGTKWVYELPSGAEQTIVISAATEERHGAKEVKRECDAGSKRTPDKVRRGSNQGIFVLVDGVQKHAEPLCIVKFPHREGRTWETNFQHVGNMDELKARRVAGPFEKVRVPAGEF